MHRRGRVAGADDLYGNAVACDPRCVDEGLESLRIAEIAGVEEANRSSVDATRARCDPVDVGPVVDRLYSPRIRPAFDEVVTEAGTTDDDGIGGTYSDLLEPPCRGENARRRGSDSDGRGCGEDEILNPQNELLLQDASERGGTR